ncbi:Clp protease N-terminal domain-containing protein [Nonomuraea basaltis]|uniref:Clp protease N-terminal domain-containing protein n=1 Tax=Nonomuraea basaltis TaxID=2495887 RepID=UPI00110C6ADA|nr:Clp protease N-terminal domain-containing protein [Nonomuraea basaltis]TMR94669.1 Clp protease [Nonomuraea basaltis]
MFERFTDRARRVVVLAQEEARMMNHSHIGTEHILLGLIHEGEGLAALVLDSCGVELGHVRAFVEREAHNDTKPPSGHIPFTQRAKKVLELSLREALQMRHNYIGTEHILLGLIREGEGLAAQALADAGADLSDVRQRLLDRVGRGSKERPAEMFFPGTHSLSERLAQIQESLERIERHLGIQPPEEEKPESGERRDEEG